MHHQGEHLCVVDTLSLGIALGNNSSLILVDESVSLLFDLEDPVGSNGTFALWKPNQSPGAILKVSFLPCQLH